MRILRVISMQELSVGELVETLQVPQSRISRHLAVLRRSGLTRDRRDGTRIYYTLIPNTLPTPAKGLWEVVRAQLENHGFFPDDLKRFARVLGMRKARSREYFDRVAGQWDRIKQNYIQDALPFLVVAKLLRGDAIALDVGTGTGDVLMQLGKVARKVIGVDSSERMLAECKARVEKAGLDNVELRPGDAEELPLSDGECDIAFCSMVLHHLAQPARGISEMGRVVKPGGRVVLIDLIRHEHEWARELMGDQWLGFTEQQIRRWLFEAGLEDVTYSTGAIDSPLEGDSVDKLGGFVAVATKPERQRDL